jgi:UDPglucose 6-dehydrogenase
MKIGFMGLGKLGLPCALAIESRGHEIIGYDPDPVVNKILRTRSLPYREEGAQALLEKTQASLVSPQTLAHDSDIIFVAIQTPHDPLYEGVTKLPSSRVDFDYSYLKQGIKDLVWHISEPKIVVIISTVLPGTIEEEIRPLLSEGVRLCYNPFFIAMGTTIRDFLNPEFVLLGVDDPGAAAYVGLFYETLHSRPVFKCTVEEAEMIKVSYNTFITGKIAMANTIMEVCHKLRNIDCDVVMDALGMADERLISTKYLRGGMGDGGGCHPRDNIALSYLARKLNLSYDWYENLMVQREKQTQWLSDILLYQSKKTGLKPVILGLTFKRETNLTVGSPAMLLANLSSHPEMEIYDPYLDKKGPPLKDPAVFFIGTNHDRFKEYKFPKGSVVIDPWRILEPQEDVQLISIGSPAQRKVAVSNLRKFHDTTPSDATEGNSAMQSTPGGRVQSP